MVLFRLQVNLAVNTDDQTAVASFTYVLPEPGPLTGSCPSSELSLPISGGQQTAMVRHNTVDLLTEVKTWHYTPVRLPDIDAFCMAASEMEKAGWVCDSAAGDVTRYTFHNNVVWKRSGDSLEARNTNAVDTANANAAVLAKEVVRVHQPRQSPRRAARNALRKGAIYAWVHGVPIEWARYSDMLLISVGGPAVKWQQLQHNVLPLFADPDILWRVCDDAWITLPLQVGSALPAFYRVRLKDSTSTDWKVRFNECGHVVTEEDLSTKEYQMIYCV